MGDNEEPFDVRSTKTDVIITNNRQNDIYLNVTYRIYSSWFGKDTIEQATFFVEGGEEKSFRAYNNDGCSIASCQVIILDYYKVPSI